MRVERELAEFFHRGMLPPRLRTIAAFAEEEIRIPVGRYKGRRLRFHRQPFVRLLLEEIDSGRWRRHFFTGSVQAGKTTLLLICAMYHLFEIVEDVIFFVPKKKLAHYKWRKELKPLIEASRYRTQIPVHGRGSQGGDFETITFRNGATLIFMSGSGADEERSSLTARVVCGTEIDKSDVAGEVSEESDPVSQVIARTKSFGDDARIYMECTVSHDKGRIWEEYTGGTESNLHLPCPHCGHYVRLERDDLHGFPEATTEFEAEELAAFACPDCGGFWSDEQRIDANRRAVLVHAGQEVHTGDDGEAVITGAPRATYTLGFRWHAAHNLFWTTGLIGLDEWKALRAKDLDAAERERKQFAWTIPVEPDVVDLTEIDHEGLMARRTSQRRGTLPWQADVCTVGIDVAKRWSHWVAWGFAAGRLGHVVDFNELNYIEDCRQHGFETALYTALREFHRTVFAAGFLQPGGAPRQPDQVLIDSGYHESQDVIYRFCAETNAALGRDVYLPYKGYGAGQGLQGDFYHAPKQRNAHVRVLGERYHFAWQREKRAILVEGDANHWKSRLFEGLRIKQGEPGALTLCAGDLASHKHLFHHLTAEHEVEEPNKKTGMPRRVWKKREGRRSNHYLDAAYMGLLIAHYAGARVIAQPDAPKPIKLSDLQRQRRAKR